MKLSAWCNFRRVTLLMLAVVLISVKSAVGQTQPQQRYRATLPNSPQGDFSDLAPPATNQQPSIDDVLQWRRANLALQAPTNAPRIDGISDRETSEIDSESAFDPFYRSSGQPIRDDITPAELVVLLRAMQSQMNTNTDMIGNNTRLVQTLKQRFDEATNQLEQNMANQREILLRQQQVIDSVVTQEDADGQRRFELSGNMALGDGFVQDLDSALKKTQPTEGALVVRNPLAQDQVVVVNDQPYTINAGSSARIVAPLGNIVTRIPGGGTYSWFLGLPQPEVFIRLVDTPLTD